MLAITELITEWLLADKQPAAIVLGGYGTGKTTFARKLAHDLAQDYLSSPYKQGLRIPVLLYLREFPRGYVRDELKQSPRIWEPTKQTVVKGTAKEFPTRRQR